MLHTFINHRSGFIGAFISGLLFAFIEILLYHNSYSYLLFLLSLVLGYIFGISIKKVQNRRLNWMSGGLIIVLFYTPIFLSFVNDGSTWNLFLVMAALPGLLLLRSLRIDYYSSDPGAVFYISIMIAGFITAILLFLISSMVGLILRKIKKI